MVDRVDAGPLAASVTLNLIELAQHARAHAIGPVVQLFFELVFDELALFFHHHDFLQTAGKFAGAVRFQRPDHADLVHPNADALAGGVVQTEVEQGLTRVVVSLATGHETDAVVRTLDDGAVEFVGADIGQRGVPLVIEQSGFLAQRVVRPADVHTPDRHLELGDDDVQTIRVDQHRGTGLDHLLDGFHASPNAGKAAHGQAVQTVVEHVLHRSREKHRQAAGLENVVALMRRCAAFGHMVVTGHSQDTAPRRGASHVGVFEHVRGAVHARAFAVPNAKHPIEFVVAGGCKTELLRAPQSGGRQFFIDAGLEHDVLGLQVLAGAPQGLVVIAQRRTTVTADEAGGVFALGGVALALQHGQAHQGLHAAHEGAAVL